MSEAPSTSISPTSLRLAPKWLDMAREEMGKLSGRNRQKLEEYRSNAWSAGLLLAWLFLIEKHRKKINFPRAQLAGRLDVCEPVISNWFRTGEITAANFAQLIRQPEFRDIRPSEKDASLHAYRVGVAWVRREVLGFTDRHPLAFDELLFLILGHQVDAEKGLLMQQAEKLKTFFPKNDDDWFFATFRRWGQPYRLAILQEIEYEDQD